MRTTLVDGDVILYRFAISNQVMIDWGDGEPMTFGEAQDVLASATKFISDVREESEADNVIVCFSGKNNFRKVIFPDYKAHRKMTKPAGYFELKELLKKDFVCLEEDKLEADDVMALKATNGDIEGETCIATIDKDLWQVPTLLFNWDKDAEPALVDEADGIRFFYTQILTGDAVDNYKGCKSIGYKRSAQILGDCTTEEEMWEAALATFISKGHTEDYAILQGQLAYMLQGNSYNFETKELTLWQPPTLRIHDEENAK